MSSRYVLSRIEIPIEVLADGSIKILDEYSIVRVDSILNSLEEFKYDENQVDIEDQIKELFKDKEPINNELKIEKEEIRKTPHPRRKNSTFKNNIQFKHRNTLKIYS